MPGEFTFTGFAHQLLASDDPSDPQTEGVLEGLRGYFISNIPRNKPIPYDGGLFWLPPRDFVIGDDGQFYQVLSDGTTASEPGMRLTAQDPDFQLEDQLQWRCVPDLFTLGDRTLKLASWWFNAKVPGWSGTIDQLTPVPGLILDGSNVSAEIARLIPDAAAAAVTADLEARQPQVIPGDTPGTVRNKLGDAVGPEFPASATTWEFVADRPNLLTAAEVSAGLTEDDVDTRFPVGHVYRYVTNASPGTTDVTTDWQKFLSLGGLVELDARVNDIFRVTSQLVIRGKTILRMGPQCVILRDWVGTPGAKYHNACFRNENAPTTSQVGVNPGPWVPSSTDDDIYIEAGRIRPADSDCTGCGYWLMGTKNLTMRTPIVERTYEDWAFAIGGENFSITGFRVEQNAELFEDGMHILYGSGVVHADHVHSGDDCFAVGSNWNLPVDGVDIYMGTFYSERAFAIKVVQNREGSTAGYPTPDQVIQNVRFHSGSGKSGVLRNGQVWMTATTSGLLSDITIDGVDIDADTETHDGANPYGVFCDKVRRLRIRALTSKNARRHSFHLKDCPDFELIGNVAKDSQGSSSYRALEIEDSTGQVHGGQYTRTLTHPVRVAGASVVSFHGTLCDEIGNSLVGVLVEGTSEVSFHGPRFRKASGATSSGGIRLNATTVMVTADGGKWDVDRPLIQGATPAYARLTKIRRSATIVTGAITTYGEDLMRVLCEGGVSDSLATISGGYPGQILTLQNAEADPTATVLTITAGSGANQIDIGSNYTMDSAAAYLTIKFDGTTWRQINRRGAHTLSGVANLNFPAIAANSHADLTITVTGAVIGDAVALGTPTAAAAATGMIYTAWVSAANTVTVRAHNVTSSEIDPATGFFRASVVR